jgi:NAD(P)-dependent dehydrogenase (short-subunit alcohol dehydrogenase family)
MAERTVLVTGATGLLGREVVSAFGLLHSGWAVKGTGYSRAEGVDVLKVNLESAADVAKTLDETRYGLFQLHLVASYDRLGDIHANKSPERVTDPK